MAFRVAVVIVTYNSERYLADLFASLRAHTDLAQTPVLFVDNHSTDGTLESLRALADDLPTVEILPQSENTGFCGGNNIGIARARALGVPYVMLLNPDTVVTDGWLSRLVTVLDARAEVAAAQPLLLLFDEPDLVNTAGNSLHFCGFGFCGNYRMRITDVVSDDEVRAVTYATGAALLLRMAALDAVGDFDEVLFLYHEDCDLQIRLRQAGWECVLVPAARVLHKYTATFSAQKYGWLERNRWLVLVKDWPLARLVAAAPVLGAVEAAVVVFSIRQGWWRQKLWSYREVMTHLPAMLVERKKVNEHRTAGASDGAHLTGKLEFEGLDHPVLTHFANPLLSAYWGFAQKALRAVGAKP